MPQTEIKIAANPIREKAVLLDATGPKAGLIHATGSMHQAQTCIAANARPYAFCSAFHQGSHNRWHVQFFWWYFTSAFLHLFLLPSGSFTQSRKLPSLEKYLFDTERHR